MLVAILIAFIGEAHGCPPAAQLNRANDWYHAKQITEIILRECSLADPQVQRGLIGRFERENADPKWFDRAEYDEFNAYNDELATAVQNIATEYHLPAAFRALARANYNDDSEFAGWLAKQPQALLWFWEAARSHDDRVQGEGTVMLGKALGRCEEAHAEGCASILSQKHEILAFLRRKVAESLTRLFNGLPEVDLYAVQALGYSGNRQDLALLDTVSSKRPGLFTVDSAKHQIEARLKAANSKQQQVSKQP